jgi:hypothetical protein
MSLKDKLEIGLKPDAPYRPDNLPEFQQNDPACEVASTPGTSAGVEQAREDCDDGTPRRVAAKRKAPSPAARRAVTARASAAARRAKPTRPAARTKAALRERSGRSRPKR